MGAIFDMKTVWRYRIFSSLGAILLPVSAFAQTPYNAPNCTANDANIVAIADQTFALSQQCMMPTDTATIRYNVTYTQNANSRYDILLGMVSDDDVVFLQDFFSDMRVGGDDPFQDLDGENDKGDMSSTGAVSPTVIVDAIGIPCDGDGDGQIDDNPGFRFIVGYNASRAGKGLPTRINGPKCAYSNRLTLPLTTSLQIVKTVINDEVEPVNKDIDFFDIQTSAGALTFDGGTTSGTQTVYTSNRLQPLVAGTFSLTEFLSREYAEGSWSCDLGTMNNTAPDSGSVTLAQGHRATCTITNDDVAFASLTADKPDPTLNDIDGSGDASAGDTLTYIVTSTNDGTVTQSNVLVQDPLITPSSTTCPTVAPGETCQLTGTYTILTADFDTGRIDNTANSSSLQVTTPVVVNNSYALPTRLAGHKSMAMYDPNANGLYAIPGEDVLYTFSIQNVGFGDTHPDSIVLIDAMPPEVAYFTGDIDDGGPETGSIIFTQSNGAALNFDEATDIRFSNLTAKPASFADCNYTPVGSYDSNVTYICFNPKGVLTYGDPDPGFAITFRAKIL